MDIKLQQQILRAGKNAHDKMAKAWFATFFLPGSEKQKKTLLDASRKVNQVLLKRYIIGASDEEGVRLLRRINNTPIEFAKSLRDVSRILRPERRGREPLLSDRDRREACIVYLGLRNDGNTRKAAVEKTAKQLDITPEQMEGILRHKGRYGDT
jgi:hypothetical protein